MSMSLYLTTIFCLRTILTKIDINLIKFVLSSWIVFHILINLNTLIEQLLSINFLFDFAFVVCFSISWSWVISRLFRRLLRLLIIFAHYTHLNHVLIIAIIAISISIISIRWSPTLIAIMASKVSKMIVIWLNHCSLNIWILSWYMLDRTMRLKSATTTLYLLLSRWLPAIRFLIFLKLILIILSLLMTCCHWAVSLLINLCFWILVRILLGHHHLLFRILTIILSVEVSRCSISIIIYSILSPLWCLITMLLVLRFSPRRVIDAILIDFILFIFIAIRPFVALPILTRWLIIIYFNHTSFLSILLTCDLNLTIIYTLLHLRFFILIYQILNVIIIS